MEPREVSVHPKKACSAAARLECVPCFGDMEGAAPLVESGADALIAFKCCIENNRRADFTEWGPHRAAVWPTRLQPLGSALLHKATSGGGVEGIAELLVRHVKPVEHVDSRGRPGPLSAKVGCAVTGQQQIARENERNRPHVASCTFVAMDPISGDSTRHAVDNLAELDRAAEDRRSAMMSSTVARDIQKPPSRMPGRRWISKLRQRDIPPRMSGRALQLVRRRCDALRPEPRTALLRSNRTEP